MPYIVQSDLTPLIPEDWVGQALDDNDDGGEDAGLFTSIREAAEEAVNDVLSATYTVPIASPENYPTIKRATRYEAARICYERRGFKDEKFPHFKTWKMIWDKLEKIGAGDLPLGPGSGSNDQLAKPRGTVITAPSKTYSTSGGAAA